MFSRCFLCGFRGFLTTLAVLLDFDICCRICFTLFTFSGFIMLQFDLGTDEMDPNQPSCGKQEAIDPLLGIDSGHVSTYCGGDEPTVKRRLYSDEVISHWNLTKLVRELRTRAQGIRFAEQHGLVAVRMDCRVHRAPMKVDLNTNNTVGQFYCAKGSCRSKSRKSRTNGTCFENVKLDLFHVYYLMYCFAHRWSHDRVRHEDPLKEEKGQCLSQPTITDWNSYCREAVVVYQLDKNEEKGKIGGPGKIVQIDERKFGKRKYTKGRRVEGHWVLGLIEDGSEDLRLEVCPDNIRSADILIPIIQKHVEVGSIIHTDNWKAYDCLGQYGYIHKKVNHSDPDNPSVASDRTHTQRVESQWRVVKRFFYKDNNYHHSENFEDFIVEYLWRRNNIKYKKDPFIELINVVQHVSRP